MPFQGPLFHSFNQIFKNSASRFKEIRLPPTMTVGEPQTVLEVVGRGNTCTQNRPVALLLSGFLTFYVFTCLITNLLVLITYLNFLLNRSLYSHRSKFRGYKKVYNDELPPISTPIDQVSSCVLFFCTYIAV